jgi:membrane associated rhomboid family serine protease
MADAVSGECLTFPADVRELSSRTAAGVVSRGSVAVDAGDLVIRARRRRLFRWVDDDIRVPLAAVYNVERAHVLVRAEFDSASRHKKFLLQFATPEEAERFAARLPGRRDATYAASLAEHAAFATQLQARGVPVVTYALAALLAVVFALEVVAGAGVFVARGEVVVRLGSNFTPLTLHGQPWRLLTSTFLHFGLFHFLLNTWALLSVGSGVERLYGRARFLLIYFAAGVGGSVASVLWHPITNSAGASGAIFGLFGAFGAYFYTQRGALPMSVVRTYGANIGVLIALNLLNGFTHPGIDNAAHLGGLVVGSALGWILAEAPADGTGRSSHRLRVASLAVLVAAAGIAAGLSTGVLRARQAPRAGTGPDAAAPSEAAPRRPARMASYAGIDLYMSREDVRRIKGEPFHATEQQWIYNALDAAHDGLIGVVFGGDRVVAVYYSGDGSGRPAGIPPVTRSADLAEFERLYGPPVMRRSGPQGDFYVQYANHVTVISRDGGVIEVGIDARGAP